MGSKTPPAARLRRPRTTRRRERLPRHPRRHPILQCRRGRSSGTTSWTTRRFRIARPIVELRSGRRTRPLREGELRARERAITGLALFVSGRDSGEPLVQRNRTRRAPRDRAHRATDVRSGWKPVRATGLSRLANPPGAPTRSPRETTRRAATTCQPRMYAAPP